MGHIHPIRLQYADYFRINVFLFMLLKRIYLFDKDRLVFGM